MRKLILASLTISSTLAAQSRPRTAPLRGSLERRLATLLDQPPFNRANWGVYVVEDGKVLFARNADRFYVPASNTKLVVSAAATVLLPADYRVTTSVYPSGRVDNGVLYGDLVARTGAVHLREPRPHRAGGLEHDHRRQLLPHARHLGHLGGRDRGAGPQALDRELRAPRSQPLRGARACRLPDEERRVGGGRHGRHERLAHLPHRPRLLRAARRVPRPPARRHHLPDLELEPKLVRRDAAQDPGSRAQRRGLLEGGARRRAPLLDRLRGDRLDGVRARGRLGPRRWEPRDPPRLHPAARLHARPSQARAL